MRMAATSASRARASDSPSRWLQAIGTFGAVLALVILGASMLLRLTTIFGVDGHTISTLPASVENAIRLAHRLAAAAVGLLALCVAIISWTRRPLPSSFIAPIAWIVVSTVMLAIIGPLTPGYRMTTVTVGNVVGGMVLLMAFWSLRESAVNNLLTRNPVEPLLLVTILVLLAHVATGASASAFDMHNVRWFVFVHIGTAMFTTMFVGATLWDRRRDAAIAGWTVATAGLMVLQLALGCALMWLGTRPVWLAYVHGMLSSLLAITLVSLVNRGSPTRE